MIIFHILVLCYTVVYIAFSDREAFAWLTGKKETLDGATILKYHHRVLVGLCLMIATGLYMFWPMRTFLLGSTAFQFKMLFVAVLLINSFIIGSLIKVATTRSYRSLSAQEKVPLFISGTVSTISWLGAAIFAFFLFD